MIVFTGDLGPSSTGYLKDELASSAHNAVCVTTALCFLSQDFPRNERVERLIAESDLGDRGTSEAVFLGEDPDHCDLAPDPSRALGKCAFAGADLRRLHPGGGFGAKIDVSCADRAFPDCHILFGDPERHITRPW